MADDIRDIAAYYDAGVAGEHGRLARHQLERDLTLRYFDRFLPSGGAALEIGAATGRYTRELARRGFAVTAVDLSASMLVQARRYLASVRLDSQVQFVIADARALAAVARQDYDAVLLMGPLYHLVEQADRVRALRQAISRLRPGGVLFSAFISRFGIFGDLMKRNPQWVEDDAHVRSFLTRGRRPDASRRGGFRGYFARPAEIAPLHEQLGLETMALAGVEPGIGAHDEIYNRLDGRQRQLWLDLLFEVSTEASTIGSSRHLLFVGMKPAS